MMQKRSHKEGKLKIQSEDATEENMEQGLSRNVKAAM